MTLMEKCQTPPAVDTPCSLPLWERNMTLMEKCLKAFQDYLDRKEAFASHYFECLSLEVEKAAGQGHVVFVIPTSTVRRMRDSEDTLPIEEIVEDLQKRFLTEGFRVDMNLDNPQDPTLEISGWL